MASTMTAARLVLPSGPSSIKLDKDVARPELGEGEVLVQVHSSSINPVGSHEFDDDGDPVDYYLLAGMFPCEVKPKIMGADLAGIVQTDGQKFNKGQAVYACNDTFYGNTGKGTWAEYVSVKEEYLAKAPSSLSLSEAAGAVPLAALTAFQALEKGEPKPGQRVLVHAGAGGVGCWAVQLAKKHYKCYVVATAGPKNQAFLTESLGADEAIDYTSTDLGKRFADAPFDVIIDPVGGDTELKSYAILGPKGVHSHILNRETDQERVKKNKAEWTGGQKYTETIVHPDGEQLAQIAKYLDGGTMFQEIAKVYPLEQVAAGLEELGTWHTRGKIVLKVA